MNFRLGSIRNVIGFEETKEFKGGLYIIREAEVGAKQEAEHEAS